MTSTWNHPEPDPLRNWSSEASQADSLPELANLYRQHQPAEPSERAWQTCQMGIRKRLALTGPARSRLSWLAGWFLTATAACVAAILLARFQLFVASVDNEQAAIPAIVSRSATTDEDEPFAVAGAAEIHIIAMNPQDADRIVTGLDYLGSFELASQQDIEVVGVQADPTGGTWPRLDRRSALPLVVTARLDEETP
jgi:hypothetical protein